jgi:predicted ATP-dependent protease
MNDVAQLPIRSLRTDRLHTPCDPASLGFAHTGELADPERPFGQERAMEALRLGLQTPGRGYNMFVLGRPGSGRHALVQQLVEAHAATLPAPPDCCYVYNFDDPQKPRVLRLPAGEGERLREAMQEFVAELRSSVQSAFDSDEYRHRLEAIQKDYKAQEEAALQALGEEATAQGLLLMQTTGGFSFAPVRDGRPLEPEEYQALPEEERQRMARATETLSEKLVQFMQTLPRLRREMNTRIRDASRDSMAMAVGHLVDELKEDFARHEAVLDYLEQVQRDIMESGSQMREQPGESDDEVATLSGRLYLTRYLVNLLVGHGADGHAPVCTCDNPTYPNMVGRVDHLAHMGTLLTNFTMIKPGALHRASGGFLLLDTVQVLSHPYTWDGLKRALRSGQVRTESLPEVMGWGSTLLLEPEPVPIALKVVLFGERSHYYLLQQLDPDFDELFRIAADFEDDVPRNAGSVAAFARLVGFMARAGGLKPCDAGAVARLVEHAARLCGHADRLSTQTQLIEEVLHEADTHAARAGRALVAREDVNEALAARERRGDRLRGRLHDAVLDETLLVDTSGMHTGQVNGLAVTELGDFRFGHPLRITATARLGDERVMDIERESTLGQPLHSKGVLILGAYLGGRYAGNAPLSFSASLVFEQSYGPVEGDSASLAELCALLSALAGAPIRQSLAVTGSVNQFGVVQAVGGVNEKVEGFFDLCRARGLNGEQGVIIPAANVRHLMLRQDVVHAVGQGRFHVHAVSDVDEAVALLSGLPAGTRDAAGQWPAGSFNRLVATRLQQLSQARLAYVAGQNVRTRRRRRGSNALRGAEE